MSMGWAFDFATAPVVGWLASELDEHTYDLRVAHQMLSEFQYAPSDGEASLAAISGSKK